MKTLPPESELLNSDSSQESPSHRWNRMPWSFLIKIDQELSSLPIPNPGSLSSLSGANIHSSTRPWITLAKSDLYSRKSGIISRKLKWKGKVSRLFLRNSIWSEAFSKRGKWSSLSLPPHSRTEISFHSTEKSCLERGCRTRTEQASRLKTPLHSRKPGFEH